MMRLLVATDHDWSVAEILREYEDRGTPLQAKDPSNALRAAIAEANKAGTIFRTAPGRYKASKWREATSMQAPPSGARETPPGPVTFVHAAAKESPVGGALG